MENFFYFQNFYSDLSDLCNFMEWDKEELESFEDDFKIEINTSRLEPIIDLSASWIIEHIDDERFTEEGNEVGKLVVVLNENIDFEKVNSLMPKIYYETRNKITVTKDELLKWL